MLDRIFIYADKRKNTKDLKTQTVHYGHVAEPRPERRIIDEALVLILRAPHTFTGEDTAEIDCHGGPYVMQRILSAALEAGARLAEPGEFTKRAFLNGRIDLSEAEAVMDVIDAGTEEALRVSVSQLRGSVRSRIEELRETLIAEIAYIEAALDDPEHIDMEEYPQRLEPIVEKAQEKIRRLLDSFENGKFIREGIRTVILGKPNAGKSTFLNLLAGEDRAIVTDIPGTTRDALEETIRLKDMVLRLADTAGIRETEDPVEKIGVRKAKELADSADLLFLLFDRSRSLSPEDREILELAKNRKSILLLNKEDLSPAFSEEEFSCLVQEILGEKPPVLRISAREETGMEELACCLREMFFSGRLKENTETVITNIRHKEALSEASASLDRVMESLRAGMPEDFYSIDLMDAYGALGRIIGQEVGDDLIDAIFSKFCMGK